MGWSATRASSNFSGRAKVRSDRMRAALERAPSLTAHKAARRVGSGSKLSLGSADFEPGRARARCRYSRIRLSRCPASQRRRRSARVATVCLEWRRPDLSSGCRTTRQKTARFVTTSAGQPGLMSARQFPKANSQGSRTPMGTDRRTGRLWDRRDRHTSSSSGTAAAGTASGSGPGCTPATFTLPH